MEISNKEKLEEELAGEENDLKALAIYKKILREKRTLKWENWKREIISSDLVLEYDEFPSQGKISFLIEKYNWVDYYPKANKVLIRQKNDWIKPGLKWLINNLL